VFERFTDRARRVVVLAKGVGATHLAPPTIDVLGYSRDGAAIESPGRGVEALVHATLALAAAAPSASILATDANRSRLSKLGPRALRAGVEIETRLLDPPGEIEQLEDWKADLLAREGTLLDAEERMEGTGATVCLGIQKGCQIVRVHDVKEIARMAKMMDAMLTEGGLTYR
jgi:hypothetical protein